MPTYLFTISALQKALKAAGLPNTKPTIMRYEKLGVIKKSKTTIHEPGTNQTRFFTQSEIDRAVVAVKNYLLRGKK